MVISQEAAPLTGKLSEPSKNETRQCAVWPHYVVLEDNVPPVVYQEHPPED